MTEFDMNLEFIFAVTDILRYKRVQFALDVAKVAPMLTPGAARILVFAGRSGPISQVALARRASLEPMTISSFVSALEKEGYVSRSADPLDRRSKLITLTEKGSDCLQRIVACMRASEANSRATVSEQDWKTTLSVLDRVRLHAEEDQKNTTNVPSMGGSFR